MNAAATKYFVLSLIVVAGCATVPEPAQPPQPAPAPAPVPRAEPTQPKENIAVAGLMQGARVEAEAGRLTHAAASLERALRIEPRNPRLWQELARLRMRQGDYAQAESLAARSNSWAGEDAAMRVENWRLIAEAREARGDRDGARAALEAARRIER
jgi:Tfp pilus assembly protein PilF